jgi:hypothetical protein
MGYRYGDDDFDHWFTDRLARALVALGISDIRDLSIYSGAEVCSETGGSFPVSYFINKRVGNQRFPFNISLDGKKWLVNGATNVEINMGGCGRMGTCPTVVCLLPSGQGVKSGSDVATTGVLFESVGVWNDQNAGVVVRFSGDIPYFLPVLRPVHHSSDTFKEFVTMGVMALAMFVPGFQTYAGSYIFGSLASAYPALTAAATSALINTALNGGDVEAAVKSVATQYVGGSIGNVVSGVSDSAALGRLANAAATAAARGGDVEQAVLMATLQMAPAVAASATENLFTPAIQPIDTPAAYFDPVYDAPLPAEPTMSIFDIPSQAPVLDDIEYDNFDFSVGGDFSGFEIPPLHLDMSGDPMFDSSALNTANLDSQYVPTTPGVLSPLEYDPVSTFSGDSGILPVTDTFVPTMAPTMTPAVQPLSTTDAWGGETEGSGGDSDSSFFSNISFSDVVSGISNTAIALLRVNQAYRAAGSPSIQPATRTTVSGANQTVRADGTIITTDPMTGATTVNRAPVGVPYVLPNGSVVTNNGDGTYTTITTSGARTSQYAPITSSAGSIGGVLTGSTMVPGVPNWAIVGGGAVALALLLKR